MTAEHGPKPGLTDYLLAAGAKLGALQGENAGVTLTTPEQQATTRDMSLSELATEIRMMRGEAPGIGEVLTEELGGVIKRRIGREKQTPSQKELVADAASMEDSTL